MKKRTVLRFTGAAFALCFGFLAKVPAYAGDINAAEQMIIDFYNGTFTYDGKTYVATEEAKASVYAKLAEDGVDLTDQEARTAIRQASAQVGDGVKQGYLTEVSGQGEDAGESGSENGTDAGHGEDSEGKEKGQGTAEDGEKPGSEGSQENGKNAGSKTDAGNGKGDGTDAGDGKSAGSGTGFGKDSAESGSDSGTGNHSAGEGQEEAPKPFRKIDMAQLLKEAEKEGESYVQITPGENFTFTAEQYLQGKITAVSPEGYVLFEGGLPLKNTGYKTGSWKQIALFLAAGLCIAFGAAIKILYQEQNRGAGRSAARSRTMEQEIGEQGGKTE
ncbi:MAG: hypothetical protein HFH49_00350 [Lachnospiraceae bacterium]|nr:hypothetical protein [Lachnospiraceae bacterium]